MTEDQARRMADMAELPEIDEEDCWFLHNSNQNSAAVIEFIKSYTREAIAAALVKLTQGQDDLASYFIAVLDEKQKPHQLQDSMHVIGFRSLTAAHDFVADKQMEGWIYTVKPLYPIPSQQEERVRELGAVCKKCNGTGVVDDGEIDCYANGEPYMNGPVKCVKDCPACTSKAARNKEQGK